MVRKTKLKPSALGGHGVPKVEVREVNEIPLGIPVEGRLVRWHFLNWRIVNEQLLDGKALGFAAQPHEVDTALRCLFQHGKQEEEHTIDVTWAYDEDAGMLWVWPKGHDC